MNQYLQNGYYWVKDPGKEPEIVLVRINPAWTDGPYVVHRFGVTELVEWNQRHPFAKWEGPLVCGLS